VTSSTLSASTTCSQDGRHLKAPPAGHADPPACRLSRSAPQPRGVGRESTCFVVPAGGQVAVLMHIAPGCNKRGQGAVAGRPALAARTAAAVAAPRPARPRPPRLAAQGRTAPPLARAVQGTWAPQPGVRRRSSSTQGVGGSHPPPAPAAGAEPVRSTADCSPAALPHHVSSQPSTPAVPSWGPVGHAWHTAPQPATPPPVAGAGRSTPRAAAPASCRACYDADR